MINRKDFEDIKSLSEEEQIFIMSMVHTLLNRKPKSKAVKRFLEDRKNCVSQNPMSMEEIDRIIHEG